jgi:hypothetical protein
MPNNYDPYVWYWLADDGRIFSGKVEALVPDTDSDYQTFLLGNVPTPWPRDDEGNQTLAELQRVLFPYRITVDLKAYAFAVRDQKEHDGCPITGVTGVIEVRTDPYTQNLISRYHEVAAINPSFTAAWVLPDRSTTSLDKAAIDSLFDQTLAFIVGTYSTYSQVVQDIDGGAITASDQIDAAFGTTLRRSAPVDIGWKS